MLSCVSAASMNTSTTNSKACWFWTDMRLIYLYTWSLLCIWHRNVSLRQSGVCLPYGVECLIERHVKFHFDQLRHIRIRQTENVFLVKNGGFIQIKIFRKRKKPNWFGWQSAEKSNVFLICRISESWFLKKYSVSITHNDVAYFKIYHHD